MRKREVWVKPEVRAAFEAKILESIAKCQPHHHETIPVPPLIFKNIGGPAGRNIYNPFTRISTVIINPAYFQKPNGYEEQLTVTLPHEVAHHITDFIYGTGRHVKDHGWQWARVMGWLGLPPEVHHHINTDGIIKRHERPYSYKCSCSKSHLLTATLHLRIQRDGRHRICKRCHSRIVYEGIKVGNAFLPAAKPTPKMDFNTAIMAARPLAVVERIEQIKVQESESPKPVALPKPTHRVVTRLINGVLTNVRIPLDNP